MNDIRIVERDKLPYIYNMSKEQLLKCNKIEFINRDGKKYFNPQNIIGKALMNLDFYNKYQDKEIFGLLNDNLIELLKESVFIEDARYFPYKFDYALHNNPDNMMKSPWYSGLAQGMALSLFSRLKEFTYSEQILCSFKSKRITHIDDDGFYWIDEYPFEPPTCVLNGFIYGLYGLYDHYRIFKDKESLGYLKDGLATVKHYALQYRNPGNVSYYCLAHKVLCNKLDAKYHRTHIGQFRMLYTMTGDKFFRDMAESLLDDHKPESKIRSW